MDIITILDTSVATRNIGDQIIVDSVKRELLKIFPNNTMFLNVPTHEVISRHSRRIIKDSKYLFVAGTNLLSSKYNILKANQWNIKFYDAFALDRVVLMGVGWTNYQKKPSLLAKFIYKNVLDSKIIHSVRDDYTKAKLKEIGITNVINTGCPTIWQLTPEHCKDIPKKKANNVVMTLTDYRKDRDKDKKLINILKKEYKKVYCWIQGSNDEEYIRSLSKSVELVSPTLEAFDNLLESEIDLDYIGTRLHAGIRAIQKKRRSIIIGVDNRALEMQKDFNINVVNRNEINKLSDYINSEINTTIKLDFEAIDKWKRQFKKNNEKLSFNGK